MGAEDGGASGTEADSVSCPLTTKAVRIFEHGSADVLRYDDYPLQRPGPRDVAVRVAAASVSSLDVKYRIGLPPSLQYTGRRTFPLPQQLGREAAGLVVAVGPDLRRFAPGDRVVAVVHPESPHSVEVARGLVNLSTGVDLPGHQSLAGRTRARGPPQPSSDPVGDSTRSWVFLFRLRVQGRRPARSSSACVPRGSIPARPTSATGRWTRCHRPTSPSARAVAPPFASTPASR